MEACELGKMGTRSRFVTHLRKPGGRSMAHQRPNRLEADGSDRSEGTPLSLPAQQFVTSGPAAAAHPKPLAPTMKLGSQPPLAVPPPHPRVLRTQATLPPCSGPQRVQTTAATGYPRVGVVGAAPFGAPHVHPCPCGQTGSGSRKASRRSVSRRMDGAVFRAWRTLAPAAAVEGGSEEGGGGPAGRGNGTPDMDPAIPQHMSP